jgi:hypothetical protein
MWRRRGKQEADSGTAGPTVGLRSKILSLDPAAVGLRPSVELPGVWGVLMEMGFPDGAATIVSLADGTTSLYTSEGGGVIGGGEHAPVAAATRRFLVEAEATEAGLSPAAPAEVQLPPADVVSFVVLGYSGTQVGAADEDELASMQHPLSRLYAAGQDVITALREAEESRR